MEPVLQGCRRHRCLHCLGLHSPGHRRLVRPLPLSPQVVEVAVVPGVVVAPSVVQVGAVERRVGRSPEQLPLASLRLPLDRAR